MTTMIPIQCQVSVPIHIAQTCVTPCIFSEKGLSAHASRNIFRRGGSENPRCHSCKKEGFSPGVNAWAKSTIPRHSSREMREIISSRRSVISNFRVLLSARSSSRRSLEGRALCSQVHRTSGISSVSLQSGVLDRSCFAPVSRSIKAGLMSKRMITSMVVPRRECYYISECASSNRVVARRYAEAGAGSICNAGTNGFGFSFSELSLQPQTPRGHPPKRECESRRSSHASFLYFRARFLFTLFLCLLASVVSRRSRRDFDAVCHAHRRRRSGAGIELGVEAIRLRRRRRSSPTASTPDDREESSKSRGAVEKSEGQNTSDASNAEERRVGLDPAVTNRAFGEYRWRYQAAFLLEVARDVFFQEANSGEKEQIKNGGGDADGTANFVDRPADGSSMDTGRLIDGPLVFVDAVQGRLWRLEPATENSSVSVAGAGSRRNASLWAFFLGLGNSDSFSRNDDAHGALTDDSGDVVDGNTVEKSGGNIQSPADIAGSTETSVGSAHMSSILEQLGTRHLTWQLLKKLSLPAVKHFAHESEELAKLQDTTKSTKALLHDSNFRNVLSTMVWRRRSRELVLRSHSAHVTALHDSREKALQAERTLIRAQQSKEKLPKALQKLDGILTEIAEAVLKQSDLQEETGKVQQERHEEDVRQVRTNLIAFDALGGTLGTLSDVVRNDGGNSTSSTSTNDEVDIDGIAILEKEFASMRSDMDRLRASLRCSCCAWKIALPIVLGYMGFVTLCCVEDRHCCEPCCDCGDGRANCCGVEYCAPVPCPYCCCWVLPCCVKGGLSRIIVDIAFKKTFDELDALAISDGDVELWKFAAEVAKIASEGASEQDVRTSFESLLNAEDKLDKFLVDLRPTLKQLRSVRGDCSPSAAVPAAIQDMLLGLSEEARPNGCVACLREQCAHVVQTFAAATCFSSCRTEASWFGKLYLQYGGTWVYFETGQNSTDAIVNASVTVGAVLLIALWDGVRTGCYTVSRAERQEARRKALADLEATVADWRYTALEEYVSKLSYLRNEWDSNAAYDKRLQTMRENQKNDSKSKGGRSGLFSHGVGLRTGELASCRKDGECTACLRVTFCCCPTPLEQWCFDDVADRVRYQIDDIYVCCCSYQGGCARCFRNCEQSECCVACRKCCIEKVNEKCMKCSFAFNECCEKCMCRICCCRSIEEVRAMEKTALAETRKENAVRQATENHKVIQKPETPDYRVAAELFEMCGGMAEEGYKSSLYPRPASSTKSSLAPQSSSTAEEVAARAKAKAKRLAERGPQALRKFAAVGGWGVAKTRRLLSTAEGESTTHAFGSSSALGTSEEKGKIIHRMGGVETTVRYAIGWSNADIAASADSFVDNFGSLLKGSNTDVVEDEGDLVDKLGETESSETGHRQAALRRRRRRRKGSDHHGRGVDLSWCPPILHLDPEKQLLPFVSGVTITEIELGNWLVPPAKWTEASSSSPSGGATESTASSSSPSSSPSSSGGAAEEDKSKEEGKPEGQLGNVVGQGDGTTNPETVEAAVEDNVAGDENDVAGDENDVAGGFDDDALVISEREAVMQTPSGDSTPLTFTIGGARGNAKSAWDMLLECGEATEHDAMVALSVESDHPFSVCLWTTFLWFLAWLATFLLYSFIYGIDDTKMVKNVDGKRRSGEHGGNIADAMTLDADGVDGIEGPISPVAGEGANAEDDLLSEAARQASLLRQVEHSRKRSENRVNGSGGGDEDVVVDGDVENTNGTSVVNGDGTDALNDIDEILRQRALDLAQLQAHSPDHHEALAELERDFLVDEGGSGADNGSNGIHGVGEIPDMKPPQRRSSIRGALQNIFDYVLPDTSSWAYSTAEELSARESVVVPALGVGISPASRRANQSGGSRRANQSEPELVEERTTPAGTSGSRNSRGSKGSRGSRGSRGSKGNSIGNGRTNSSSSISGVSNERDTPMSPSSMRASASSGGSSSTTKRSRKATRNGPVGFGSGKPGTPGGGGGRENLTIVKQSSQTELGRECGSSQMEAGYLIPEEPQSLDMKNKSSSWPQTSTGEPMSLSALGEAEDGSES